MTENLKQAQIPEGNIESPEKRKQRFLDQGFLDVDAYENLDELEKQFWRKDVTAVYYPDPNSKIYEGLRFQEFEKLKGYGFWLPDSTVILVSLYNRNAKTMASGWLFKPQEIKKPSH